jgi:hypothetical protein
LSVFSTIFLISVSVPDPPRSALKSPPFDQRP